VNKRHEITERLAMALHAKQGWPPQRATVIRKAWEKLSWSLKSVYVGAAEEVLRDGAKLGLVITLKEKP
jgi:hypothetical protein